MVHRLALLLLVLPAFAQDFDGFLQAYAADHHGFETDLAYYPDDQLTVIVLSNVEAAGLDSGDLGSDLAGLVHGGAKHPGTVFSGALERVREGFLTVRLADGPEVYAALPPSGDLSAAAIAAHYHLADQVQIECAHTKTIYDAQAALHLQLSLKTIRLVRAATSREQAQEAEALSWRAGENLLTLPARFTAVNSAAAQAAMADLDRVRKVNLDHISRLPDFVADETSRRYRSEGPGQPWKLVDSLAFEVSVKDGQVTRQNAQRNGKPLPLAKVPGFRCWSSFFGDELRMLDPGCSTSFEFAGLESAGRKELRAYRFSAPPDDCFTSVNTNRHEYLPGYTGRVLVDAARAEVLRFESEGAGFPEKFGTDRVVLNESWDYVAIGGKSHLVPAAATLSVLHADGSALRAAIEYRNHRHFEASTHFTYGPGK